MKQKRRTNQRERTPPLQKPNQKEKQKFPDEFPFWARLKISKRRTTLVIDETIAFDKQKRKDVEGFVHRDATSKYHKGFEKIEPNPDRERAERGESMYLKKPQKLPKTLFEPHNKKLDMPQHLKERYSKNKKE